MPEQQARNLPTRLAFQPHFNPAPPSTTHPAARSHCAVRPPGARAAPSALLAAQRAAHRGYSEGREHLHVACRAGAVEGGGEGLARSCVHCRALAKQQRAHLLVPLPSRVVQRRVVGCVTFVWVALTTDQELLHARQVPARARAAQPALEIELVQRLLHRLQVAADRRGQETRQSQRQSAPHGEHARRPRGGRAREHTRARRGTGGAHLRRHAARAHAV